MRLGNLIVKQALQVTEMEIIILALLALNS